MIAVGLLFVRMLCDCFKPRQQLQAEILVASTQRSSAACVTSTAFLTHRGLPEIGREPGVGNENLIRIDCVTESRDNVRQRTKAPTVSLRRTTIPAFHRKRSPFDV
jgi:hypothetical protein